jgi:hypothetical protein
MKFNRILPHIVAAIIFLVAVFMVFGPAFSGKELRRGDLTSNRASSKESKDYYDATGDRANWSGTNFSGMPTYLVNTVRDGNMLQYVTQPVRGWLPGTPGMFFLGMVSFYLFLLLLGADPWLSIAGAVAASIATTIVVIWVAGHSSKTHAIFYLPLIASGVLLAFQKRYLLGGLIFALGLGLTIMANHHQMLYYFGLTLPILGIAKLAEAIKEGELASFGKSVGVLVIGLMLAVGAGASNLLTLLDYTPASMRGGQVLETPLVDSTTPQGDVPKNGLSWDYAMMWSNDVKDLVATYAPLAAGGGGGQAFNNNDFSRSLTSAGFQAPQKNQVPAYHGGKIEGTAGPEYLGAVIWALFIFGLFTARRSTAIWLGAGTLLVMILSMGKYAEGLNHLLYDLLPMFNKFRAPSSALNILPFMMAGLGVLGVNNWWNTLEEDPEKGKKQFLFGGIAAAAFGLIVLFVVPAILGFGTPTDANLMAGIQQNKPSAVNGILDGLESSRKGLYMADAWRSFLFVGLVFGVLFLMFKKIANPMVTGLLLLALVFVDFSGVNKRYLTKSNWAVKSRSSTLVQATPADQQILADTDPHFRVLNLTTSTWQDATTSYYHKSIGGYSAVKMRRYQDMITGYLGKRDPDVLNMMNMKYAIVPGQNQQPAAQQNPAAYGAAWLVNKVERVSTNDAEFAALGTIADLRSTAIVHDDFASVVDGFSPSGEGTIQLTKYTPDELTYSFNSTAEQLAVFSEVWYGPDKGWELSVDGQPAEVFRTNYILRGARIPAGQHTLVMSFRPSSFYTGKTISLFCSLLIILGLAGYAFYFGYWEKKKSVAQ